MVYFAVVAIANDPTPRPGMERAILFITPPVESQQIAPLDNLIAQVQQQDVVIHIWLISSAGGFQTVGVKRLTELANQTGGDLFAFSGEEVLPDPETFLQELRPIYQVAYQSSITNGGVHQLSAQVETENGIIETPILDFEINLQSPQPAFVSPPTRIIRQPAAEEDEPKSTPPNPLEPAQQTIQVVFDFPDGRKRPILSTSLWVDGVVAAENTTPPFDTFVWDLSEITSDGTHTLQVQVTDSFQMTGSSVEIPVLVSIKQKTQNPWAVVQKNTPILIVLAVVISGAILLLVLILGGQLRPRALRISQMRRRKSDPVTQPVAILDDLAERNVPNWVNRLQRSSRNPSQKALAYLYRLSDGAQAVDTAPFPITTDEISIGSSANQANLVLEDASVEKLHARLIRNNEGSFRILDEGSIAGTWINYSPVSREGAKLEHGDIIHIGRVGFRFTLRQPQTIRRPVITPLATPIPDEPPLDPPPPENSTNDPI